MWRLKPKFWFEFCIIFWLNLEIIYFVLFSVIIESMTNVPPVNEETVIFKTDRQAAGKVCKTILESH